MSSRCAARRGEGRELLRQWGAPIRIEPLPGDRGKQIAPFRVLFLDQADLPVPPPLLERLFTGDRISRIVIALKPDQTLDAIFRREPRNRLALVLTDAANKIAGNPEIQRSMPSTGEKVDAIRHRSPVKPFRGFHTPSPAITVIPGRPARAGPGTYEHGPSAICTEPACSSKGPGTKAGPVCMGSGLAAAPRPGMTILEIAADINKMSRAPRIG